MDIKGVADKIWDGLAMMADKKQYQALGQIFQAGREKTGQALEFLRPKSDEEARKNLMVKFGDTYVDPNFAGTLEKVGTKAAKAVAPKAKQLTTKFLDYIGEKLKKNPLAELSRQEITDFAKRPELKKGEADLLLKKLEEFDSGLRDQAVPQSRLGDSSESLLGADNRGIARRGALDDRAPYTPQTSTSLGLSQDGKNLGTRRMQLDGSLRNEDTTSNTLERALTYSKDTTKAIERKVAPVDFSVSYKDSTKGGTEMIVPLNKLRSYVSGLTDQGGKSLRGKGAVDLELTKDGDFAILDGNNRIQQAIEDGYTHIPARVQVEKGAEQFVVGQKNQKISATDFADSLRADLLELKPVKVGAPQYKSTTIDNRLKESDYALTRQDMETPDRTGQFGKNYEEVVFESPITTNGSSHYPNSKNYFAHVRGDEVVEDGKKIWREQEIQSDLLQKDKLESIFPPEGVLPKGRSSAPRKAEREFHQIASDKLSPFTNDRFGERIMRERIREKAQKGYSKYRLPTGDTISKIQGHGDAGRFYSISGNKVGGRVNASELKIGQEVYHGMTGITPPMGTDAGQLQNKLIVTRVFDDGRFNAIPKKTLISEIKNAFRDIPESEIMDFIKNCL